jgi:hypothetical protein
MDCRQADIPRSRRVTSGGFQVIQECPNQRSIDIRNRDIRGSLGEPFRNKTHEQAESIAVARDGVRAYAPFAHKPIREEGLEQCRER